MRATMMLVPALALLCSAAAARADPAYPIPDVMITADEFDDTIAFTPDAGAQAAMPPLEVHEVDPDKATAAGAKKVVDGRVWLDADDYERNDILLEVEDAMPDGTELVIDVSSGDIWEVPLAAAALLPEVFRLWTDEEYARLDEGWDPRHLTFGPLTRKKFLKLTLADQADSREEIELHYVKSFGAIGRQEIKSLHGFQVALMTTWLRETPEQRYLRMLVLYAYYARLPQFQGQDNRLVFALMAPQGALYVLPYFQYRYMLARSGIQAWSLYDMAMLPVVLTIMDRQIRGDRFVVERFRD
jgi:hypothetical protein